MHPSTSKKNMSNLGKSSGLKRPSAGMASTASQQQPQNQEQKSIIEIYTDWANHYLDKLHGGKKKIKDLQTELCDGVVLAEVVEAVMASKVPEVTKKPKTHGQCLDNIQFCLIFLAKKGVAVNDIHAKEIREGNLKAILGLFFQLSRFKQQQKLQQQQQQSVIAQSGARSSTPRIPSVPPSPARGGSGATSIPMPSSASSGIKKSFLPAPKAGHHSSPGGGQSMLKRLASGMTSGGTGVAPPPPPLREVKRGLGKRTSSSSGFSSARSIGSESSVSLSSDTNFPSPSAMRRINENPSHPTSGGGGGIPTPRSWLVKKSIPTTAMTSKMASNGRININVPVGPGSPKSSRSPKLQRAKTEIKDYGPIDQPLEYPPHHASNLTKISTSSIPAAAGSPSRIPNAGGAIRSSGIRPPSKIAPPGSTFKTKTEQPSETKNSSDQASAKTEIPQGCSVKPNNDKDSSKTEAIANTSENDESTAQMTASFHSRTKSLPRTKRREDGSPGPANVAVVNPMPCKSDNPGDKKTATENAKEIDSGAAGGNSHVKDDSLIEDPCKGLVPLGPLGLFSSSSATGNGNNNNNNGNSKPTHQLPFSRIGTGSDQMSSGTTIAGTTLISQGTKTHENP